MLFFDLIILQEIISVKNPVLGAAMCQKFSMYYGMHWICWNNSDAY
jgi:hypothetical protein